MPGPMLPPPKFGNLPANSSKPSGALPLAWASSCSSVVVVLVEVAVVLADPVEALSCERGGGGMRHTGAEDVDETEAVISEVLFQM